MGDVMADEQALAAAVIDELDGKHQITMPRVAQHERSAKLFLRDIAQIPAGGRGR